MTNEQKAIELLDKELGTKNMSNGGSWFHKLQLHYIHLLCEMAEWKEKQLIDKTCKWLKNDMLQQNAFQGRLERLKIIDGIIERFRKAIMEE